MSSLLPASARLFAPVIAAIIALVLALAPVLRDAPTARAGPLAGPQLANPPLADPQLAGSLPPDPPPVLLNEIYYDHPGSDSGYEFVELLNPGDAAVPLLGYRLLAGDGAGAGRWRAVWQAQEGDVIAGRSRFVIGESLVSPPADRTLALGLENGPDALRLVAPDGRADVVGYGALTFSEYFAGNPAPDVAAGHSLARWPDGANAGDNSRDFAALSPPTPGAPNRPERDAELVPGNPALEPRIVAPGEPATMRVTLVNRGLGPVNPQEVRVLLWAASATDLPPAGGPEDADGLLTPDSLVAETALADPLEAGDSLALRLSWAPPADGAYRLAVTARLEDDGVAENHRVESCLRAGIGPLVVSEVLYAPKPGEPEWVEVRARGNRPVDLTRFLLADATGRSGRVAPSAVAPLLEPDSQAVLAADAAALRALRPELDSFRVCTVQPWPTLNNSAAADGEPADRVVLSDDRGVVSDAMSYAGGAPPGYSIERRDAERPGRDEDNWGLSALEGGTPCAPNSVLRSPAGQVGLAVAPRVWHRGAGGPRRLSVTYRLAWERAVLRLAVIDARGRERACLHDGPASATGALEWDGKGADGAELPPGAYAVALEARPAGGGGRLRLIEPVVVEP